MSRGYPAGPLAGTKVLTSTSGTVAWVNPGSGTDTLDALAKTDGNFCVANGSAWVVETGATARTSMGVGLADGVGFASIALTSGGQLNWGNGGTYISGTASVLSIYSSDDIQLNPTDDVTISTGGAIWARFDGSVQALVLNTSVYLKEQTTALGTYGATWGQFWVRDDVPCVPMFKDDTGTDFQLGQGSDTLGGLTPTDGNIAVGDGASWVAESGDTARISLGVGTTDSPTFTDLTLSNDLTMDSAGVISWGGNSNIFETSGVYLTIQSEDDIRLKPDDDIQIYVVHTHYASFDGGLQSLVMLGAGGIYMTEQVAALADTAGQGQWWVKTATPNLPMFTDDAGGDFEIATQRAKIITDATTTRTLTDTDNGRVLDFTSGSSVTVTVPAGLVAGFNCSIIRSGSGSVTVAASGTTVNSAGALLSAASQHSRMELVAVSTNTYNLSGDRV